MAAGGRGALRSLTDKERGRKGVRRQAGGRPPRSYFLPPLDGSSRQDWLLPQPQPGTGWGRVPTSNTCLFLTLLSAPHANLTGPGFLHHICLLKGAPSPAVLGPSIWTCFPERLQAWWAWPLLWPWAAPCLPGSPPRLGRGGQGEKKGHLLFSSSSCDRRFSSSRSGSEGTATFSEIPGGGRWSWLTSTRKGGRGEGRCLGQVAAEVLLRMKGNPVSSFWDLGVGTPCSPQASGWQPLPPGGFLVLLRSWSLPLPNAVPGRHFFLTSPLPFHC